MKLVERYDITLSLLSDDLRSIIVHVVQAKIEKEEEIRKRKKNQPSSHQLYDEKETSNKILEKNQQQKAEFFELEVDIESDDDEEELNKTILAKLKTLGISQNEVKIKKPEELKENIDESKLEELEEGDISKYIGGEEAEDNDKLFG